jgi:hypothetical protein
MINDHFNQLPRIRSTLRNSEQATLVDVMKIPPSGHILFTTHPFLFYLFGSPILLHPDVQQTMHLFLTSTGHEALTSCSLRHCLGWCGV